MVLRTDQIPFPEVARWYQRGSTTPLRGHDIFYIDEGDTQRPALLLLHGFPTSSWDWQPVWPALAERFRLVALDMLGFGFSAKPAAHQYSIHEQADIVEALVVQRQLGQFHVLAHDYGDTVAQELLARQNEGRGKGRWLSICFLNGGLFPETHRALLTQKLLLGPLGPLVNRLLGKAGFDRSFSKVFGEQTKPRADELAAFWYLINLNRGKHVFHSLITYINDRRRHRDRWVGALIEAAMPLALINGSVDPVSGAHMVARYRELGCRLDFVAELPDIGHYPQVEAPAQVTGHFLDFIDAQASAGK